MPKCGRTESVRGGEITSRMLPETWRGDRCGALARHGSRFTKGFEETVAWLGTHAARSMMSEFMGVEWHTVGGICARVYQELEETSPSRFNGLVNIGIDETSYKKGYKYMTVVVNHDTSSVV